LIAVKFDENKVINCIQAYKEEHNKNPYLIMSEKTQKLLSPNTIFYNGGYINNFINSTKISGTLQDDKTKDDIVYKPVSWSWYSCKIMIDNDLEFGEIHIG